jgi:hypothetical protein
MSSGKALPKRFVVRQEYKMGFESCIIGAVNDVERRVSAGGSMTKVSMSAKERQT